MPKANNTNLMLKSPRIASENWLNKLGDFKMMRLRPKKKGKQGRPRRYHSNIRWKGEKIQVPLDATEYEKLKAIAQLGIIYKDLKNGIHPQAVRQKIKKLKIKKKVIQRNQEILDTHLYPFFGLYRPRDIDLDIISSYIEYRYGLCDDGKLQAVHNTIDKELIVLQMLVRTVDKHWIVPRPDYEHIQRKGELPPLTFEQIQKTALSVPPRYIVIYWAMAYTALDIGDVTALKQFEVKNGWINSKRGKTKRDIHLPICKELQAHFDKIPINLDGSALLFPCIENDKVSKEIIRAFKRACLPGYGSKYLRRFVASIMADHGYEETLIGTMLAHAPGSKLTSGYIKPYDKTLIEAFACVGRGR